MPKQKKTSSRIFEQLERELSQKDLEAMKNSAVEFLLRDIEILKHFIEKINEDFGQEDLVFALKMFILSCNKVFNMAEYMQNQSKLAEEYIKSQNKNFSPEERRAALTRWIEDNAGQYRKHAIFKQIYCIDKLADEIIPVIKKAIGK
jgi:hypothetical protein